MFDGERRKSSSMSGRKEAEGQAAWETRKGGWGGWGPASGVSWQPDVPAAPQLLPWLALVSPVFLELAQRDGGAQSAPSGSACLDSSLRLSVGFLFLQRLY